MTYTPEQMRAHAAILHEWVSRHSGSDITTHYRLAAGMLTHGADAVEALAAKDAELAQWKCNNAENRLIAEENSRRSNRAESALTAERAKVRELREWLTNEAQSSDGAAGLAHQQGNAIGAAEFFGDASAHRDGLAQMDALGLTGEEPR